LIEITYNAMEESVVNQHN